jgi:hypothetical protein
VSSLLSRVAAFSARRKALVIGVWLVVLVSARSLELLLGATILAAVAMSVAAPELDLGGSPREKEFRLLADALKATA